MIFRLVHQTEYQYLYPAMESFAELRLWPVDSPAQHVRKRHLEVTPDTPVEVYTDYFGNQVEWLSIPHRHTSLKVAAFAEVETLEVPRPVDQLEITIAEARQIYHSQALTLWDFLRPTQCVPTGEVLAPLKRRFLRPEQPIGEALTELNQWIFKTFRYMPGTTDISTPVSEVIRKRRGVCQDFAHLMLSILRTYGIPSRYISGYIEAYDPETTDPSMIGATASHAWVQVYLPGGLWWGYDPTNNQESGLRHVEVAFGRDYQDAAPLRGTYKGGHDQSLEVMVKLKRRPSRPGTKSKA